MVSRQGRGHGSFLIKVSDPELYQSYQPVLELIATAFAGRLTERLITRETEILGQGPAAVTVDRPTEPPERANRTASRTRDEFLAMLGHELRNPLSPILISLQLMRMRGDQAPFAKERAVIERQTRHLMRLVDDLLDVSRITRGKIALDKRVVQIGEVIFNALETASPLLEERGHKVTTRLSDAGLQVHADENRLTQVISNLLTNAAKYTAPGGSIEVAADRDADWVLVTVKDNGMGIDAQLLPHIFDRFVQGQRGLDRSEGGLGLGLAIVRSLVEAHAGLVTGRSEGPGRGSEFAVRLPVWTAANEPSCAASDPGAGSAANPSPARRVLIVDDNRDAAEVLREALQERGYQAYVAGDAPSALQLAPQCHPEVALLDIGLPVMDGYELGRRIRELPELTGIHLIALTGYGQQSDLDRSREAGFEGHLVKPVDLDEVVRAIDGRAGAFVGHGGS